jgi:NTE family protein/lysophospholipid hydrolase
MVEHLASTALLGSLGDAALRDIEPALEWIQVGGGETLIRQGDLGDCLYIVIYGRLRVFYERADGREETLGEVARGEAVGEMAVLTGDTRSTTVRAIRDTDLVRLSRDDFDRLAETYPQLLRQVAQLTVTRLRAASGWTREVGTQTTVAVIPANKGVPLAEFTHRLVHALSQIESVLHLDSQTFDNIRGKGASQVPEGDPRSFEFNAWFTQQERAYRFVLFESDITLTHWTRRCVRQADRILVVGQAAADPDPGEIENTLLQPGHGGAIGHQDLALIHSHGPPSNTGRWLAPRQIAMHHHIRWDTEADFARLARFVSGHAVGLVLSGGGARGFAHIGVIRALEEAGVPIDLIGGTSMGAFISAGPALGWNYEAMVRNFRRIFGISLGDFTIPRVSLLSGRSGLKRLERALGQNQVEIEDLQTPYFCISSNLTRAEVVVHRNGPLVKALFASVGLPGILPPVHHGGDLLVDGGLLNNLPVDIGRSLLGSGAVIASDVSLSVELADIPQYGEALTGWQVLWSRLNPYAEALNVPSIVELLHRSGLVSSIHRENSIIKQNVPDLYIDPPVEKYDLLGFRHVEELAELGYQFAKGKVAEWQRVRAGP